MWGSTIVSWGAQGLDGTLTRSEVAKDVAFIGAEFLSGRLLEPLKIGGGGDEILLGILDHSLNITKELVVPAFQQTISNNKEKKKD